MKILNVSGAVRTYYELVVTANHKVTSIPVKAMPGDWWARLYSSPYNQEGPAWTSSFVGVVKGHRGTSLVAYIYEDSISAALTDPCCFNRDEWEAVASYAQNQVIW